ncbi:MULTISPECIES: ABC transporter substrate-binding protein [Rhizobium]|uniref:Raffinose/stachyose/melibiose transport system substrate-binding protein n=1 Tax=Rhizobium miluonense TaxID=411945 RepID=A0A1C3WM92_9HYPH|nr:extracellular solute-binding protein [Rhizobium miluonense]SCB41038.1 raffinose/stachyose/melibiose transport system substrate-binding protein [Rhizobium miluonense]
MNIFSKLAVSAGMSLLLAAGVAQAQGKTFNVWWYELPDTPQAVAWTKALGVFKAKHPDVTVNFEQKTFDQLQKAGSLILNSDQAPDVLEYNKGNATAGLVASQGLLTPLDDEFKKRGWGKVLNETNTQLSKYDQNGVYGSGPIIGIPALGEFVSVFYNIDMFQADGLKVPTTLAEFEATLDHFKQKGITPLAYGTVDSNAQHLLYTLALTQADDTWVKNYQGLKAPLDTKPFLFAAQKIADWVGKGYISKDSTGLKGTDAANVFSSGKAPMFVSGTWNNGNFANTIKTFKWSQFIFPTTKYTVGSTGSMFMVPKSAKNKDLAYDFIDLVLSKDNQNEQANLGGVAIDADPAAITDEVGKRNVELFHQISSKGGLGFYPDWPVPGYYELLIQATTGLVNGSTPPDQLAARLKKAYDDVQAAQ